MKKAPRDLKPEILLLRDSLLDLTGIINRPHPDAALIAAARDRSGSRCCSPARAHRAAWPARDRELAELCGRDYTTVSRQITKLEELGLVNRTPNGKDARIKEVSITAKGRVFTHALDAAREDDDGVAAGLGQSRACDARAPHAQAWPMMR